MPAANCKPLPHISQKDLDRFWEKVDIRRSGECWPWKGARSPKGYGVFEFPTMTTRACRIAYYSHFHKDPFPDLIRHSCDNPPCCNPEHFLIGSHADNMVDMRTRRRSAIGDRNGSRLHPELLRRGSTHGMAKLTESEVESVRVLHLQGKTCFDIAEEYGVNKSTIARIVKGLTWAHAGGAIEEKPLHRRGTQHKGSKLTEDLVREIRSKYAAGGRTYQSLADEYGMSFYATYAMILRKTWTHVQ